MIKIWYFIFTPGVKVFVTSCAYTSIREMTGVVTVLKGSYCTSGTLPHLSAGARSLISRVSPLPNRISSWSFFTLLWLGY